MPDDLRLEEMRTEEEAKTSSHSILHRRPRLILTVFLVVCFTFILAVTEAILKRTQAGPPYYAQARYLSIRELARNMDILVAPSGEEMEQNSSSVSKVYRARTDSNGYLIPSIVHEHPDLVMAFLGGSTTETIMVEEDKRWPYLVGRLLESRLGAKVNSLNAGVGADHSMHAALILLAKIIPEKPNIAVLMENVNDLGMLYNEGTYWSPNAERPLVVESQDNDLTVAFLRLVRDFKNATVPYTYRAITSALGVSVLIPNAQAIETRWTGIKPLNGDDIARNFRSSLLTFVGIANAWSITPVLMTQANRYSEFLRQADSKAVQSHLARLTSRGLTATEWNAAYDRLNETIREVGKETGVQVIDLDRIFPKNPTYFLDMIHFNTAGSELVGEIVARELAPTAKDALGR